MKKKPSTIKDILFLSISSFIVVVAWVGFNIYHSYVTTTITPELQIQIIPIQPEFDMATIQTLKTRRQVQPITNLSGKAAAVPTPTIAAQSLSPNETTNETQPAPTQLPNPEIDIPITVQGE